MSHFSDYGSDLTARANGAFSCNALRMDYLDGGAQEKYTALLLMADGTMKTITTIVPGNTNREKIFADIIEAANA